MSWETVKPSNTNVLVKSVCVHLHLTVQLLSVWRYEIVINTTTSPICNLFYCNLHLLFIFVFPGPWSSIGSSLILSTLLVSHENLPWGPQTSLFLEFQVQTTASFSGEDVKYALPHCPKDTNPGGWGLSTKHLVLSHHQGNNRRRSLAAVTPQLCSLRVFLSFSSSPGTAEAEATRLAVTS